jgi:hypothetical protein
VDKYVSASGYINWALVANVLTLVTSYTGQFAAVTDAVASVDILLSGIARSKEQCRDRYFNVVLPREEGKEPATASTHDPKRRLKRKAARRDDDVSLNSWTQVSC